MPMAQIRTSWTRDQLFDQFVAMTTDDPNWMVQAQTAESLVLRREKTMGAFRWIWLAIIAFLTLFTCGIALLLAPTLLIGLSSQQISIRATQEDGKTVATVNYTSGARRIVNTLIKVVPQP